MPYRVRYSRDALRAMRRLPRNIATNIQRKVELLARKPEALAANIRKLQGRDGFRLRIGDYRVIYMVDDEAVVLLVIKVGARGGVYVQDSDD